MFRLILILLIVTVIIGCTVATTTTNKEVTTVRKFLGKVILETTTPIETTTQKISATLFWANKISLIIGLAGLGIAVAIQAPAIRNIGTSCAVAGGAVYAVTLSLMYILASFWWILLACVAVGAGLLIWYNRNTGIEVLYKWFLGKVK